MSLSEKDRRVLEKAVAKARRLLEQDFSAALEGRFGIHDSGRVEEESALALAAAETAARQELVGVVDHLGTEGLSAEAAVARVLREGVFTTMNRLVAVRVAEVIGLLPESLAQGRASTGYREFLDLFPLLTKDTSGGYWTYLRLCADELAHDAPVLFDPRNPLLVVEPSPKTLDEIADVLADPALVPVWADSEAFGWTYQYFNSADERRAAREEAAPRDSRELAVRNQFFTPRYVVDFLVQNTLGRRLLEANPESELRGELRLLVDPPSERGAPLDLEEVRVLDPAVGSGHFLLGCYDLLERAWEEQGVAPAEAAARILPSVWGIDIDPRCAQVAAAAIVLRARRRTKDGDLPRPKVFTARPLPEDPAAWERALSHLDGSVQRLARRIQVVLKDAPVLGSLLKVEEALRQEIERHSVEAGAGVGTLFEEFAADAFGQAEGQILTALKTIADETASTTAERLLAAEATDALGFVEAMRSRYHAVLMNPPFGEPVPDTKRYLKAAYPWIPWKDYNLLGAFVGRGVELLHDDGYLGAITSRAGLFLTTFEAWRKEVLLARRLVSLADLGFGVMEGALVEAAAYVVGAGRRRPGEQATFLRLLKDTDRPGALVEASQQARERRTGGRVFRVAPEELEEIPGAPLAYWVPPSIRRLFTDLPPLEGNGADVRQGLATADDFRFVRTFWEVDPTKIGRSREETLQGKRWVPFAKGGEYSPYYADIHLVVDWGDDGRRIREFEQAVVRNPQYYFHSGLTWPLRTTSGLSVRCLPAGCIFGHKGPLIAPAGANDGHRLVLALGSRLVQALTDVMLAAGEETTSGTVAKSYEVGILQRVPHLGYALDGAGADHFHDLASEIIAVRASLDSGDETSRRYNSPGMLRIDGASLMERLRGWHEVRETVAIEGLAGVLDAEVVLHQAVKLDPDAEHFLDEEYGPHPASYPKDSLSPEEEQDFARLYQTPIEKVIDEVVETRGGSRTIATKSYFLDRRLEVFAHVFGRHPQALVETRRRLGISPPEELRRSGEELVSYLVGCALGRWDIRIGRDSSVAPREPGPFDPLPVSSPSMLVGGDGFPAREMPPDYPLELPPDRLLLDEEDHPWDIVLRVRRAAEVLLEDPDGIVEELERILARDLRTYVRRDFFKAHLGRYSKSRRKAPIYWHLSVPSRDWALWVYAPTLSRETLFGILREARRKQAALVEVVGQLKGEVAKAEGREGQRLAKRLEAEERLLGEVASFAKEADRVANLGWEPDLDDGIILCSAPLADLFPAWRAAGRADAKNPADPTQARRMIKAGKYAWATVSKWTEAL